MSKGFIIKKENGNGFIDTHPGNLWFLGFTNKLKEQGIRNWEFPLTVINPEVTDINLREELSSSEAEIIYRECLENPWYFIREIISNKDMSAFRPSEENMAAIYCFLNGINAWVTTKDTSNPHSISSILTWAFMFKPRSDITVIGNSEDKCFTGFPIMGDAICDEFSILKGDRFSMSEKRIYHRVTNNTINLTPIKHNLSVTKMEHIGRMTNTPIQYIIDPLGMENIEYFFTNNAPLFATLKEKFNTVCAGMYGRIVIDKLYPRQIEKSGGHESDESVKLRGRNIGWENSFYDLDDIDLQRIRDTVNYVHINYL